MTKIEQLADSLAALTDRASRETAQSLVAAILELHGTALERLLQIVFHSGPEGQKLIRTFAEDQLVAGLLVLHNLHPDPIEVRVQAAAANLNVRLESVTITGSAVRVRIHENNVRLIEEVKAVIRDAAPDATEILLESSVTHGFVPLSALRTLTV